jgi:hypothetical protein
LHSANAVEPRKEETAAAIFLLLQACLGLHIRALPPVICFAAPLLPEFLREVHLCNLRVGAAAADLLLRAEGGDVLLEAGPAVKVHPTYFGRCVSALSALTRNYAGCRTAAR